MSKKNEVDVEVEEKEACKYCKEEFSSKGIYNHERFCSENPKIKAKEEEERNKGVEVKATTTGTIKVLGKEYVFSEGNKIEVPKEVAKVLKDFKLAE